MFFLFILPILSKDVYAARRGDSQTRSYNGAIQNGQSIPAQNVSFSRESESVRSYKQVYQLYSELRTAADKTQKYAELLKLADSILDQSETEDFIFAQTCEIKGRVLAEKAGADRQEFQPYLDYVTWLENDRRASVQPQLRESRVYFWC
ncbi:MAG: hypothetical protein Q4F84_08265 [Fibrobacter sp.]|nr:hypothetical protein [Fibrobacter sp.]